jgi:hypothetical protein
MALAFADPKKGEPEPKEGEPEKTEVQKAFEVSKKKKEEKAKKAKESGEKPAEEKHHMPVPEDDEEYKEKLEEAVLLTQYERLMLELGWLVEAVIIVLTIYALSVFWPYQYIGKKDFTVFLQDAQPLTDEQRGLSQTLYEALYGRSEHSWIFNVFIITLSLANFVMFALQTELRYQRQEENEEDEWLPFGTSDQLKWVTETNNLLQYFTILTFGILIVLRTIASAAHPFWDNYGSSAPMAFLIGDFYTHVEILALMPSILELFSREDRWMNLTFITLARSIEMMYRQGSIGSALRQAESLSEDSSMIKMVFLYSGLFWVILSGFFYVAHHNNDEAEWEAAKYNDKLWNRFASIPSSMFFVLVNLSREYPLADINITPLQRLFSIIAVVIGVPIFSLPTGIIGSALQDKTKTAIENRQQAEGGDQNAEEEQAGDEHISEKSAYWMIGTFVLSFGSVLMYFFYTATVEAPDGAK